MWVNGCACMGNVQRCPGGRGGGLKGKAEMGPEAAVVVVTCATGESTVETPSMWQRCGAAVTVQSSKSGVVAIVWAGPPI